jgi:hypothetical protein
LIALDIPSYTAFFLGTLTSHFRLRFVAFV